jgi:MarR family transcriptional regulator, organic hydroperoxide resistance regulator
VKSLAYPWHAMPETCDQPAAEPSRHGYQPGDFEDAFRLAKHALAQASTSVFARHGVYEGQQFVLRLLWREDGLTPSQLARQLGLSSPTVTRAATRMEAAGLLRREPHPGDRRLVRLRLTARGRELERVIGPEMSALTEQTLAGFGAAERAELIAALRRIHGNLSAG